MTAARLARTYFLLQGIMGLGWWAWLIAEPSHQSLFFAGGAQGQLARMFLLPDLVCFVVASWVIAALGSGSQPWSHALAWLVTGSTTYATLFCLGQTLLTPSTFLALTLMIPAALLSGYSAYQLQRGEMPVEIHFRENRSLNTRWIITKTLIQTVLFWSIFLWWIPAGLVSISRWLHLPEFHIPAQLILGTSLFIVAGALGLWSSWQISTKGDGTPLPLDCARELVVSGPYRWVRNPMAIAGLGQALGVGIAVGNPLILAYTISGLLVWHFAVRPLEEADLLDRFGKPYQRYRDSVRCWIPRLLPYHPKSHD